MKQRFTLPKFLVAVSCLSVGLNLAVAQTVQPPEAQMTRVILTTLSPPMYPALARQASIQGDVSVTVLVRPDGTAKSAVVSGSPLLSPAASSSALKSLFECRGCTQIATPYAMVYTFELAANSAQGPHNNNEEAVTQSQNHVTVVAEPLGIICAYTSTLRIRARSAKCLYLWKCSLR
jgi:hypothetical protein